MPHTSEATWRVAVDTGGTFTDVVAVDPQGAWRRLKFLSDASVRQTVTDLAAPATVILARTFPDGVFDAARLHDRAGNAVGIRKQRGNRFELTEPLAARAGEEVVIRSPLQAAALAAHWVTGTPVDQPLPVLQLRLATTRATNCLLERQGARCAVLLTAGLEDVLEIGTQQRPELFARVVRRSPALAESSVGVGERLDADGTVLQVLDEEALRVTLQGLRDEGVASLGIALLHSYRNDAHEARVAAMARDVGFDCISLSSQLSARQGYLERARATEIDAYLMPVMRRYLDDIGLRLRAGGELLLMSSAAQLLGPERFHPKDSLLSGPAGGVAGAAHAARVAGVRPALAFDMGGTSTDVARIDGEPELTPRHRVGDATLWAAAVDVETVASGGGSLCWVENGLPQVGPRSAGAAPGPACYGRGGPLAVTDVNLLLGRIRPQRFPFALDVQAARQALQRCLDELAEPVPTAEELLEGFLRVANEKMAEAMRRVTLRRGQDPRQHHLIAFGGAGGQHACAIAELLDLASVVIPPDPGLLSAMGVAQARRAQSEERQVLRPLSECTGELETWMRDLVQCAVDRLQLEGAAAVGPPRLEAELRFVGQEAAVTVDFRSGQSLEADFLEVYERIHLHRPAGRRVELVTLRAIVSGGHDMPPATSPGGAGPEPDERQETTRLFHADRWQDASVAQRRRLQPGTRLRGPMLVEEENSVFFLPQGWRASVHGSGCLVAVRQALPQTRRRWTADPTTHAVDRQLFRHRFESIAREMGERLRQAAVSTNVKEREDFSCALLDTDGRLVVNAPHIPVHLGALGTCVRSVRENLQLEPGDFIVTNHPRHGGSHLPDITVLAPVHDDGNVLLGYVACRAHHAEIGGITPGSMPAQATRLVQEGVVLPPLYLARGGHFDLDPLRRALVEAPYPTRALADNLSDAEAMLVACRRGAEALRDLAASAGRDQVLEHMRLLRTFAADRCRQALRQWGDRRFTAGTTLDDGTPLRVDIELQDGRARIDFTGSAPTHPGNLNATEAVVTSCVLYVLRLLAGDELPFNEGLLDPVELAVPPGILSPDFSGRLEACPAIVGGNVETSQCLVDLLLAALSWSAGSQGTMNNLSFGNDAFGYYETLGGGTGAGPDFDGASAVHSHMTNTRITDVEVLEHRHPVRVRRFRVRRGSGGRGLHRGGDGLLRELEFTQAVRVSLLTQHRTRGPEGAAGGGAGAVGRQWVQRRDGTRQDLPGIGEADLGAGDRVVIETPGGGGWGEG